MAEPDASGRVAGAAGRGLGLLILVVLAWKVLAQGVTLLPRLAEGLIHDWNYILGRLGLLGSAETIGRLLFAAGVLTMLAANLFLALELLRCVNAPPPREELGTRAR